MSSEMIRVNLFAIIAFAAWSGVIALFEFDAGGCANAVLIGWLAYIFNNAPPAQGHALLTPSWRVQ